jgi:hypothetical protein
MLHGYISTQNLSSARMGETRFKDCARRLNFLKSFKDVQTKYYCKRVKGRKWLKIKQDWLRPVSRLLKAVYKTIIKF